MLNDANRVPLLKMEINPYASPTSSEPPRSSVALPYRSPTDPLGAKFDLDYATLHYAMCRVVQRSWAMWLVRWLICGVVVFLAADLCRPAIARGNLLAALPLVVFTVAVLGFMNSPIGAHVLASLLLLTARAKTKPGVLGKRAVAVLPGVLVELTTEGEVAWPLAKSTGIYHCDRVTIFSCGGLAFVVIPDDADFGDDNFDTFSVRLAEAIRRSRFGL